MDPRKIINKKKKVWDKQEPFKSYNINTPKIVLRNKTS